MKGKTIRLLLVDGSSTGILTAEIGNWTGKLVMAPRASLARLISREEAKRTGVYLLVGPGPETGKTRVYVGEGDRVWTRLVAHDKDEKKSFWTHAVIITSKDENLTKAHGRFLESRIIKMIIEAGQAEIDNSTTPDFDILPEPDKVDMENFLVEIGAVLPVLGFTFTQPKPRVKESTSGSPIFLIDKVGVRARAQEIRGEFVVLKDSTARAEGVDSWKSYRSLRDQLIDEGKIGQSTTEGHLVFLEDVPFSSPSGASSAVLACNSNGRTEWKMVDGMTYGEWRETQIHEVIRTGRQADPRCPDCGGQLIELVREGLMDDLDEDATDGQMTDWSAEAESGMPGNYGYDEILYKCEKCGKEVTFEEEY